MRFVGGVCDLVWLMYLLVIGVLLWLSDRCVVGEYFVWVWLVVVCWLFLNLVYVGWFDVCGLWLDLLWCGFVVFVFCGLFVVCLF